MDSYWQTEQLLTDPLSLFVCVNRCDFLEKRFPPMV